MLRYHIVFVGCSLEDEILRIRRKLCFDFSSRIPTAYALLPESENNVAESMVEGYAAGGTPAVSRGNG